MTDTEREEHAADCVAQAEIRLLVAMEPQSWRRRAADIRIAIGLLARAAALMEALAKEEQR